VGSHTKPDDILRSIDKSYCDTVLNFLIRLACQVNDPQAPILSPGESLSRRYVLMLYPFLIFILKMPRTAIKKSFIKLLLSMLIIYFFDVKYDYY